MSPDSTGVLREYYSIFPTGKIGQNVPDVLKNMFHFEKVQIEIIWSIVTVCHQNRK